MNWYKTYINISNLHPTVIGTSMSGSLYMQMYMNPSLVEKYKKLTNTVNELIQEYVRRMNNKDAENVQEGKIQQLLDRIHQLEAEQSAMEVEPKRKMEMEGQKARAEEKRQQEDTARRYENIHKLSKQLERLARKHFPLTENPGMAGYMMSNGDMLALSYGYGKRDMDHRQICEAFPDNMDIDCGSDGMRQFMLATGAIRMSFNGNSGFFDMEDKPNAIQISKLVEIFGKCKELYVTYNHKGKNLYEDDIFELENFLSRLR